MYMHYLNSYRPFHFLGKKMPQSEMGNFFNLLSPFLVTSAGMRETDSLRRPRLICHRRCKACKCCSTGLLSIPIMSLSKVWSKLTDCPLENPWETHTRRMAAGTAMSLSKQKWESTG